MFSVLPDTDPILRQVAKLVEVFDSNLSTFCINLETTMTVYNGLGLAAPQVGVSWRIIVVKDLGILINPKIISTEGTQLQEEGCLSSPGIFAKVRRALRVVVEYQDINNNQQTISACGLPAVILQHEIDHLNGKLFLDYLSPIRLALSKKQKKLK